MSITKTSILVLEIGFIPIKKAITFIEIIIN